ncbi:hypothetical protein [Embleya hyalina]|uniref:hypothetical protein n=1 Tax=Embleya hyalina TaxID=516124 RepID=UPI000F81E2B3|nr:hypothetical protein [Embleya hyalina]
MISGFDPTVTNTGEDRDICNVPRSGRFSNDPYYFNAVAGGAVASGDRALICPQDVGNARSGISGIHPPGWPKASNGDWEKEHPYARCHIIANSLGGPDKEVNLFTCVHDTMNNSWMKRSRGEWGAL